MNPEIQRLKDRWHQAINAHLKQNRLFETRDEVMVKILSIEKEIKKDLISLHQKKDGNPALEKRIEGIQTALHALSTKKQQVDTLLDDIEELTGKTIEDHKNQLIEEIFRTFPDARESYDRLQQDIKALSVLEKAVSKGKQICQQLCELIQKALDIRHSLRGFGLLQYVFGRSPNMAISQCFHDCIQVIKAAVPFFDQYQLSVKGDKDAANLGNEAIKLFQEIDEQCKKQWGFRHLDTTLTELLKKVGSLHDRFQHKLQASAETKLKLEQEMEKWIEHNSVRPNSADTSP